MRNRGKSSPVTNLKGLVTSSSPFSPFSLSDMIAMGIRGFVEVGGRQWQGGVGRSGDGSEVVRLRWFDPRRFVHTQFARRFPGEQAPRALSICVPVTKPAKHFDSPATTPPLHSPLQLRRHQHRQHVQSHQGPFHAAHSHDGHAAYAHDGYAPEPATLYAADHGSAQPGARTFS